MIELNDMLLKVGVDPKLTFVMRHRPTERALRDVLPWLAEDRQDLFVAYQSQHAPRTEASMSRAKVLASFIADGAGRALFVGLYAIDGSRRITPKEYWAMPENDELKKFGTRGPRPGQDPLWFRLRHMQPLAGFKGRLVVN